jgi:hypothetical protein
MPRKAKLTLKEEREKIKEKTLLSQEEANSLEQMIEKKGGEKIDISQFKEFLNEQDIEIPPSSPSLKKINAPQKNTIRLEGNFAETLASNNNLKEEENGSFKYNSIERKPEGPKYIHYEGKIVEDMVQRTEIQNIGKGNPFERRETGFESSPQAKMVIQESFAKYTPVKKIDREKLGKEKPFERKEIKYTPEKY